MAALVLLWAGSARADKLVRTKRYTFTPPTEAITQFPFNYIGTGDALDLQLGDRLLFRPGPRTSTMQFIHHCFKKGDSFWFITLSDDQDITVPDTFRPIPTFKFDLKLADGEHPLEVNSPMVFVTITDAILSPAVSTYNSPQYNTQKARNPCQADFQHQSNRTAATQATPADIIVMVCRPGVGGDDKECK